LYGRRNGNSVPLRKEIPEMPELPVKIPGVWAEDNPPKTGSEHASGGDRIKGRSYSC
jgi:hypothetical protein